MRAPHILAAAAVAALMSPAHALAAPPSAETVQAVEAAERAAAEAEQAAAAARDAMQAAERAAKAARVAATAARAAITPGGAPAVMARAEPPATLDENLPVTPGVATKGEREVFSSALSASVANGPNDSLLKASKIPDFQLSATTKDKSASIAWTVDLSSAQTPGRLSAQLLTLTATSKLDDDGNAEFLNLKGFTGDTEVGLKWT